MSEQSERVVVKLRATRFLLSVVATAVMGVIALAIGIYGVTDSEWVAAAFMFPIGVVLTLVAFRMLNHAYLIDGTRISYHNGVLGRVTRSVDLVDVVLVTLLMLGRRPRARITLWAPVEGAPSVSHRVGRWMAGDRAIVAKTEQSFGPLRAVPVDLDLVGGDRREPIWHALDAAGLPVEGTHSFPITRTGGT